MGEGNGNPLQCSCLENPRDGGAWWAAVCGVAQSRTRLKRLSSSSREEAVDTLTSQGSCEMVTVVSAYQAPAFHIVFWNPKQQSKQTHRKSVFCTSHWPENAAIEYSPVTRYYRRRLLLFRLNTGILLRGLLQSQLLGAVVVA